MDSISTCFQPSPFSVTGKWLRTVDDTPCLNTVYKGYHLTGYLPENTPIAERIRCFAANLLSTVVLIGCAVADLLVWASFTITIIPAYQIGCKNHFANLVATVALPFLALAVPFGHKVVMHENRPFLWLITLPKKEFVLFVNTPVDELQKAMNEGDVRPNEPDRDGIFPLSKIWYRMYPGVERDSARKVELLLKAGANPNEIPFDGSHSPLQTAAAGRDPRAVELLLQHGANPTHEDKQGFSALDLAMIDSDDTGHVFDESKQKMVPDLPSSKEADNPEIMDTATRLIKAGCGLNETYLDEIATVIDAVRNKQPDVIDTVMARDAQRVTRTEKDRLPGQERRNPYLHNIANTARLMREDNLDQYYYDKYTWIVANKDALKKIKADDINNRTDAIEKALKTCSDNGMPRPIAEMISRYCYC